MASERQALEERTPYWGEHKHRYDAIINEIGEQDIILDIACGTGYGTNMLAGKSKGRVVGGDISEQAVQDCSKRWNQNSLEFKVLDGTNLDFPDNTFDVLVSFETIEHTTEYMKMLSEFNRVLKPNGRAFISTPNFPINSPTGVVLNKYHTQEFVYEEVDEMMNKTFNDVSIFGQKYIRYQDSSFKKKVGKSMESLLLQRGVRKLPLDFQDSVMKGIIDKPIYPTAEDFDMISGIEEIKKCRTFFITAKKKS